MRRFALPLLALTLAGCLHENGRYPSLLPRDIEKQTLAEPERPTPVAAPDATLDTRIADLSGKLDAAVRDFTAAAQTAEAKIAVAQGVPEGSDAWLDAQTAMAEVEAAQSPVHAAVADIEQLGIDRAAGGNVPYPALDAAIARAEAAEAAQESRIKTLEAASGTPKS